MHFVTRNYVFWCILRKNPFRGVGCSPQTKKVTLQGTAKSCIWRAETPEPFASKFCMPGDIHDIITSANICEDRLRGFDVARGRILAFSQLC